MTVRRKLFFAMASLIIAMSLIYVLVTVFVVNGILRNIQVSDKSHEIELLSDELLHYYKMNHSWEGIQEAFDGTNGGLIDEDERVSYMLLSNDRELIYMVGDKHEEAIKRLGIQHSIKDDDRIIATLHYYEPEAASLRIIQLGVSSSVTFILLIFTALLLTAALIVAYWLSKRFTAPLQALIPAIDRLGKGELGTQAPVLTKDEYGTVALSFNTMSTQLLNTEEARRNLVADVAHELRTPLTILRGQLELVQQSGRSVEPESLLPLQDELIRLTRLVDDLHQLSLAESRKLPLTLTKVSLTALLERVIERVSWAAEEKDITVEFNPKLEDGHANLTIDANRISQVFLNLLTNAVRYTSEGGSISIALDIVLQEGHKEEMLRVTIEDTGDGIAPQHLPNIFNRFYRTDEARARFNGGMGLGLAIAKEYVLVHKGTIEAKSTLGIGTIFTVKLPRR